MKIVNGFKLKIIQGKDGEEEKGVIIAVGEASKKLNGIITLNETATKVFKYIENGLTFDEIVDKMLEEFEVERCVLEKDINSVILEFKKTGVIDE